MTITVVANDVIIMFNAHAALLKEEYGHIPLPTEAEVAQWLAGEETPKVKGHNSTTRAYQFKQLISAIGARVVDRGNADAFTYSTYKALWTIKIKVPCVICGKDTKSVLLFRQNTCSKARCPLQYMRQCI
jgi:hypothetical protein